MFYVRRDSLFCAVNIWKNKMEKRENQLSVAMTPHLPAFALPTFRQVEICATFKWKELVDVFRSRSQYQQIKILSASITTKVHPSYPNIKLHHGSFPSRIFQIAHLIQSTRNKPRDPLSKPHPILQEDYLTASMPFASCPLTSASVMYFLNFLAGTPLMNISSSSS